jgi:hypothetical protein
MLEEFKSARRVSTPILAIKTMDPAATQFTIAKEYESAPLVMWDAVNGLRGINALGKEQAKLAAGQQKPDELTSPVEMLAGAVKMGKETILFMHNSQLFMSAGDQAAALVTQAIWNLRDAFKMDRRTLVMLGSWFILPPEINQDVAVLDEPLPTDERLSAIVVDQHRAAKLKEPDKKTLTKAVDALRGLAAFSAEQVTAMSLTKDGLNMLNLWERKRQTIEQTPGLSIYRGKETFDSIKGYDNAENYLKRIFDGKTAPKAVMYLDELEKSLAGATGGDLSGVKQDMLGALLSWMQDFRAMGIIFIGVPGGGKSAMAKAAGNYGGVPTISFDLAGMQESLVGKSGQNIRNGLKVVNAVSNGNCLVIATCNSIQALPPELRRRFTLGTFFFDLPGKYGRDAIWQLYIKKPHPDATGPLAKVQYEVIPDDSYYTGAEIQKCCEIAWRLDCALVEASSFIVPVAKSAPDQLAYLRNMANGTFISASDGGIYCYDKAVTPSGREYNLN